MDGQAANGPIPKLFSPMLHAKLGAAKYPSSKTRRQQKLGFSSARHRQ
jgi:hypothetical protein